MPLPCPRIRRTASRDWCTEPSRFTSTSRMMSSNGTWSSRPNAIRTALLSHTSMRPNRSTAAPASRATASGSATSVGTASASASSSAHCRATSSRASARLAASTRRAPFAANASALARPIPDDAPDTTTTASRIPHSPVGSPPQARQPRGPTTTGYPGHRRGNRCTDS